VSEKQRPQHPDRRKGENVRESDEEQDDREGRSDREPAENSESGISKKEEDEARSQ
jgi:hypothetical protein